MKGQKIIIKLSTLALLVPYAQIVLPHLSLDDAVSVKMPGPGVHHLLKDVNKEGGALLLEDLGALLQDVIPIGVSCARRVQSFQGSRGLCGIGIFRRHNNCRSGG